MCPNAQGMADGEGFPDRSVAAQARDSLYSRGHLRRRQVELAEGNVELPVFLLALLCTPPHYDNYDGVRVCGCRAEALCSLVIIILILLPSGPQKLQVFEENSCTSYPLSPPWYIHPGVLGGSFWECSEIYYWVIKWNLSRQIEASGARGTQHKASDSKISSNLLFPPPTHSLIPPHFHSLNGNSFNLYCVKTGRACVFEFTLRVLRLDLQQVNRSVCHLFLLLANHLPHLCLRSSSCSLRGHLEISYCG